MSAYGDGQTRAVLSVIISDWNTPGWNTKRAAKDCTPEEIAQEVWFQMTRITQNGEHVFRDAGILRTFLDPDLMLDDTSVYPTLNVSRLLTNCVDSVHLRPQAVTDVDNLMLAGDWV